MKRKDTFPQAQIYTKDYIKKRINWLEKKYKISLRHISKFSLNISNLKKNIENLIGCVQIPIGVAGPLKINGEYTKGEFYIPMATTEKSLVSNYQIGMKLLSLSGGVKTLVLKNEIHISPLFVINGIERMKKFIKWIKNNFEDIKNAAEKTTSHGELVSIIPKITGEGVILIFRYFTKDAMGANMINIATEEACKFIKTKTFVKKFYLRSNFSSDKKVSSYNFIEGYGKEVFAEAIITNKILRLLNINIDVDEINRYYNSTLLISSYSCMIGINAHVANLIAAIFTACGQDIAHVINSSIGIATSKILDGDTLYLTLYLPNLLVGTVGGGTSLETQRECLELLGCYGKDGSMKFSEIICASALAGELGIVTSLLTGVFTKHFRKLREVKK